jgi:5-carboxymethyl-2-hydroxymuconate isomerase
MQAVFEAAKGTGLFATEDIKVRVREFDDHVTGGGRDDFIHVFAYIMEGRTTEQRSGLSRAVVSVLKDMFPTVPVISMNVMEFEKATYQNRNTV